MTAFPCILVQMSAEQIIKEIKALTPGERAEDTVNLDNFDIHATALGARNGRRRS